MPQKVLDASSSVVYIEVETFDAVHSGSGFLFKKDNYDSYFVTNYHVIEDNFQGINVWVGGEEKHAFVVASDEQYDISVIKVVGSIDKNELQIAEKANQGDEVFAVGYPSAANVLSNKDARDSNEATITNGIISSIRNMKNVDYGHDIQVLQINAVLNPGNSGGPLLNSNGQVIGVNTYGVADSQGVFGAISSVELLKFLEKNNLRDINLPPSNLPGWLAWVLIGAAIAAAVVLLIVFRPKIEAYIKTKRAIPLNEFVKKLESPINANTAVSLLMPVIIQLQEMHNKGIVYLKLSPSNIKVTGKGGELRKTESMPTDEFCAPEMLKGGFAGIKADIYGICAILRYLIGNAAEKDLDKAVSEKEFGSILAKGLSENPADRFNTVQDLIYALSPFNIGISKHESGVIETERKSKKAKRTIFASLSKSKKVVLIASSSAFMLAVTVFLCSLINYYIAMEHAKNFKFKQASDSFQCVLFGKQIFFSDFVYIEAGLKMEEREYENALYKLSTLENYYGAEELISETKYRKAAMLAEINQYEGSIKIYTELEGYKDSADLINDMLLRQASYLIIKENKFDEAIEILEKLQSSGCKAANEKLLEANYQWGWHLIKCEKYLDAYNKFLLVGDYKDAKKVIVDLRDSIYYTSIDDYRAGEFSQAKSGFKITKNYLNSDDYLFLIKVHESNFNDATHQEAYLRLLSLIEFEDAKTLIAKNSKIAKEFLVGTWKQQNDGITELTLDRLNYGKLQARKLGIKMEFFYNISGGEIFMHLFKYKDIILRYTITVADKGCILLKGENISGALTYYRLK